MHHLDGFGKWPGDRLIGPPSRRRQRPGGIFGIVTCHGEPNTHDLTLACCLIDDPFHLICADSADGKEQLPLVRIGTEIVVHKQAIAVLARHPLKWKCDQIAGSSLGEGVLVGEEAGIGVEAQMMAPLHCPGEQSTTHFTSENSGDRRLEKNPDVTTIPGS